MLDVRYTLRQLGKSPGFTAIVLLIVAGGIGACAAIFSVVDSVLFRPLPYPESERLVVLRESNLPRVPDMSVAPGNYFAWRAQASSFEQLVATRGASYSLTGSGEPERVRGQRVTANFFSTLRTPAALGRSLVTGDDQPGKDGVVVLAHEFWLRRFGGRPEILDRSIVLDGQAFRVIGVMPRGFPPDEHTDLFTPLVWPADARHDHRAHYLSVFGRLRTGATLTQAQSEISLIADRLARQLADNQGWGVRLVPMLEAKVGSTRPILLALLGAVGFLLLIACANVANLLLARATTRAKEVAVRTALGASRGRIVRQLLVESLILAALGGTLGVLAAHSGVKTLVALVPHGLPRAQEITVDARAILISCGLALLTGVVFGLAPAVQSLRLDLNQVLKEDGRGTSIGGSRQRLRSAIVVLQVGVAFILLVGAGLLIRSFAAIQATDTGFRPAGAVAASVSLSRERYATGPNRVAFADQSLQRLTGHPAVAAAGATHFLPFSRGGDLTYFRVSGAPPLPDAQLPTATVFKVAGSYFRAMGIPVLRGRGFQPQDRADGAPVAIVNERMARTHFGGEAVGKRIAGPQNDWREIVGVVADVKLSKTEPTPEMQLYLPFAQSPSDRVTLVVRAAGAGIGATEAIRSAVYAVDESQPIASMSSLEQLISESLARPRFAMLLFAVFSAAALLLAALGVYGVMAYAVAQRTGEFGIRRALGAQTSDVLRLALGQAARLVILGLALGLVGALWITRFLEEILFGVRTDDPSTYLCITAILVVFAGLASLLPAKRAASVEPMKALRAP
jgi:putative ABC transport system permease protein